MSKSYFTVKAKHVASNQTRKFSFEGSYSFPSYEELQQQLCRVFTHGQSYRLSRLIFAPQPEKQILICMEAHDKASYEQHIRAYVGGVYPGATLKLDVHELAPRKELRRALTSASDASSSHTQDLTVPRIAVNPASSSSTSRPSSVLYPILPPPSAPPFSHPINFSAIPPPPIIFSSASSSTRTPQPMEVDATATAPAPTASAASQHCCSVAHKKQEVQVLLSSFLRDFDRLTTSTFGASTTSLVSTSGTATPVPQPEAPPQKPPKPWQSAPELEAMPVPGSFTTVAAASVQTYDTSAPQDRRAQTPTPPGEPPVHRGIICDSCNQTVKGVRHKCMKCRDFDLCTACIESPGVLALHGGGHKFFEIPTPQSRIHRGIVCDSCDRTIVGSRHKCLDCADFDICTKCREAGRLAEMTHNPFHEFYEIKEPGKVVVHNLVSGEGQRDARAAAPPAAPPAPVPAPRPNATEERQDAPAVHNANCDLCDSRIVGERYKCVACPDFDTCKSCFAITSDQHPGHGFVKITKPGDLQMREMYRNRQNVRHYAWCDVCKKTIFGVRYKCMHPSCPDFDLCENCEAHPIAVHPASHPLLKMKTHDTVIPTVYRVGGTTLIPEPQAANDETATIASLSRLPTPVPTFPQAQLTGLAIPGSDFFMGPVESTGIAIVDSPFSDSVPPSDVVVYSPPMKPDGVDPFDIPEMDAVKETEEILEDMRMYDRELHTHLKASQPTPITAVVDAAVQAPVAVPHVTLDLGGDLATEFSHLLQPVAPGATAVSLIDLDASEIHSKVPQPVTLPPQSKVVQSVAVVNDSEPSATPIPSVTINTPRSPSPIAREPLLATPATSVTATSDVVNAMDLLRRLQENLNAGVSDVNSTVTPEAVTQAIAPMLSWVKNTKPSALDVLSPVVEAPFSMPGSMPGGLTPANVVSPVTKHKSIETEAEPVVEAPKPPAPVAEVLPELENIVSPAPTLNVDSIRETLASFLPRPVAPTTLRASFVSDMNIPDGQVFPPGAEFVKSWVMRNDGDAMWPETTELVFVAGDRMSSESQCAVGVVPTGSTVTISTPELKAPEVAGRYVSYWRLCDAANGNAFGSSVWIDIAVAEPSPDHSAGEGSLASSAVIMPHSVSGPSTPSVSAPAVVAPSSTASDDAISIAGSIASSMSLIDAPDSDDEAVWEDSRSHVTPVAAPGEQPMEYVVLYEESASSEED